MKVKFSLIVLLFLYFISREKMREAAGHYIRP